MNCLPLLRVCARLLDLHDSERLPGNSAVYTQEERRGGRNGIYLDLASLALDSLRNFAHESGNAFVGFDALFISVRERARDADPEELRYVLNVLARPTELWTIERTDEPPALVSDKQTNLVERTHYADDYRLTAVGRAAVSIASNIAGFVYAEGDALKLLRAIEAGDFAVVPAFCDGLLDTIRYTSVGLRQEIERGHVDRESDVFKVKMPRFRDVIEKTSELLRQAGARLRAWQSSDDDALADKQAVDIFELEQHVVLVYQALESFGRDLSDLTKIAAQRRGSAVESLDFLEVALSLVRRPPTERQLAALFRQFGPLRQQRLYVSPEDVAGKVRVPVERPPQVHGMDMAVQEGSAPDARLTFLAGYGDAIRQRLAAGPLPLSEALGSGWCVLDGHSRLSELLGVYVAPWVLTQEERIVVRMPRLLAQASTPSVGELVFSDLEIARLHPSDPMLPQRRVH